MYFTVLIYVFIVHLLKQLIFPIVKILFNYTLGKRLFSTRHCLKQAGEWAIVTGGSRGIGRAYAEQLASDGLNVMIISENKDELESVAKEITNVYGVETRIIVADFTQNDIYEQIQVEINKLSSIACLVNNVGMCYDHPMSYTNTHFIDMNFIHRIINCNMTSTASMTKLVLPKMISKHNSNFKPTIIMISSITGCFISPYITLYGATKSFMRHFGNSLSAELRNYHITVQTVHPYSVATSLSKIKSTSFFVPSPQKYVSNALDMLGVEKQTCGYFRHALVAYLVNLLPESIIIMLSKNNANKFK